MSSKFYAIEPNAVLSMLKTKISKPKIGSETLLRSNLTSKLSGSIHRRLTVVCAPAGYGKTTAVASWLRESEVSSAWVSLDKRDNDPVKFWSAVFAGVQSMNSALSRNAWDSLYVGGSASWDAMVSAFIDDLDALQDDVFLVFDDYHFIAEPVIHEAMERLIRHGPSRLHIVLISRESPPFSVARLRAQGQVLELGTLDLRFDTTEIPSFYQQVMKMELSSEDLDLVEHHTEGWVAGMNLVALALRSTGQPTEFLRTLTGNHRFIAEYLAEEVIKGQPSQVQDFWLKTSILSRLSGPLCQAVTGEADASELLQTLALQSSFLIPLDDEHRWFRYHHLFADVLQEGLLRRLPDELMDLHRRACAWFESMNLIPEAIEHALRGKDYDKATSLIYDYAPKLLKDREVTTLLAWIGEFPSSNLNNNPQLCVVHAWGLALSGQYERAEQLAGRSDECSNDNQLAPNVYDELWVESRVLRGFIALLRKNVERAVEYMEMSTRRLPKYSRLFQVGAELNEGEPYVLRSRLGMRGYLNDVSELYPQLRAIFKNSGLGILGYGSVALAELYYEWDEFEQLKYFIPRGIELGKMVNNPGVLVPMYLVYARYVRATDKRTALWHVVDELENIARQSGFSSHWLEVIAAFKVRMFIEEQNEEKVREWLALTRVRLDDRVHAVKEFEHITLARALLYQGELDKTEGLLRSLSQWAETEDRLGSLIEVSILQALVYRQQGHLSDALASIHRAVTLACPHQYRRTFFDEGMPALQLVQGLLDQESTRKWDPDVYEYVQALLSIRRMDHVSPLSPAKHAPPALIDPLTKRELTILQLVSKGYSNTDIASMLNLSVGTVKGYNHKIFGKLGVKNRTQAVARAKEIHLLE